MKITKSSIAGVGLLIVVVLLIYSIILIKTDRRIKKMQFLDSCEETNLYVVTEHDQFPVLDCKKDP